MTSIPVKPFPLNETRDASVVDYEDLLYKYTFHDGKGLYRLVKSGGSITAPAGCALVSTTDGGGEATAKAGANAGSNFLGIAHPLIKGNLASGYYFWVLIDGIGYWKDDSGGDVDAGDAVGSDANGLADVGASTNSAVVLEEAPSSGDYSGMALVELYQRCVELGA